MDSRVIVSGGVHPAAGSPRADVERRVVFIDEAAPYPAGGVDVAADGPTVTLYKPAAAGKSESLIGWAEALLAHPLAIPPLIAFGRLPTRRRSGKATSVLLGEGADLKPGPCTFRPIGGKRSRRRRRA